MSDDGYVVDLAELDEFVRSLKKFLTGVEEKVTAINSRVDELHVSWAGEAADAHRQAHDRWRAGAKELHEGTDAIAKAARRSHDAFQGVQDLHRRMWP